MATAQGRRSSIERVRAELTERLQARRGEIEQAALTRIHAVSDGTGASDPEYAQGLRAALSAAIEYSFAGIERGEERAPPIPTALLAQARLAACSGVSLDTVLRRYFAGYTLLGDFLMCEAEQGGILHDVALQRMLRAQAALFDRLIAAVTEEYERGAQGRRDSVEERRAERVRRLLDGELLDTSELRYDFAAHHLGAIVWGRDAATALRSLAATLDRRLLMVGGGETLWAWLGGRRRVDPEDLERIVSERWPVNLCLALGEPAQGPAGWRLTHRQAKAALPIALRSTEAFTRYGDVALLASMLQDDLLATSLPQLYLAPLERERDGGETLRETLRAYFAAERNVSSAAVALGVSRQTVNRHLHTVEHRLGWPLGSCAMEIEAALRLEELSDSLLPFAALSRT
jgi:hypothetical protein